MTTAVTNDQDLQTAEADQGQSVAASSSIIFELEGIVGSMRQATFDVLKSILGEQGAKITPVHISRYCLQTPPEMYLESLLEAVNITRQSMDKLLDDIRGGIDMQLSSKSATLPQPLSDLFKTASAQGVSLAAISALSESTCNALLDNLGLTSFGVRLFTMEIDEEGGFPRADSWLKVARSLERHPAQCGVIATSHAASKSALSAGMRCVAIPDAFTGFEDFSGANTIIEDLADTDAETLLRELCPHLIDGA